MSAAAHDRESICTASGLEFFPLSPRAADVRLADIAHALSHIARFAGHTSQFYSVAQHSVHVVRIMQVRDASWEALRLGIVHDAAEAYLGDIPSTIKRTEAFRGYRLAERRVEAAIWDAFAIMPTTTELDRVKAADRAALEDERAALMPACDWWGASRGTTPIDAWNPEHARHVYLSTAHYLGIEDPGS